MRLAVGALFIFALFRLPELTRYALWYDELFSVTLAQMNWGDLLQAAVQDRTNPPLFYALLKLWIGIGGASVAWMRLLPCMLGIAAALPLAALARRTFSPLDSAEPGQPSGPVSPDWMPTRALVAAAVTLAAAAASPLLVLLANELRGYSLLLLLTATSMLAMARFSESAVWLEPGAADGDAPSWRAPIWRAPIWRASIWRAPAAEELRRRAVLLAAVNTLLVYTHYFGWLVVAAQIGAALLWQRNVLRQVFLGSAATAALFAPWAIVVAAGAAGAARPLANISWIAAPTFGAIPVFYDALVARVPTIHLAWVGMIALAVPIVGLLASLLTRTLTASTRRSALTLLWYATFPVLAVFAVSVASGRPIFVPRYLVVAAPAWWLLIGLSVTRLPGLNSSGRQVLVAGGLFAAFTMASGALRMVRGGEKIAWDRLVTAIATDAGPSGGTIYTLEGFTALPVAFYAGAQATGLTIAPLPRAAASLGGRAWLVVRDHRQDSTSAVTASALLGRRPTPLTTERIPSQVIRVYRLNER